MRLVYLLLVLQLITTSSVNGSLSDSNGGVTCAACSIIVGLAEQLTQIYNESIANSLSRFCSYLPSTDIQKACMVIVDEYSPGIIRLIEDNETPDIICYAIELCHHDTNNDICHLYPLPKTSTLSQQKSKVISAIKTAQISRGRPYRQFFRKGSNICDDIVFKPICQLINRFTNDHKPIDDFDGDLFSDLDTFRGTSWRGKDCNDLNDNHYPGRISNNGDPIYDSNCNGVFGLDISTDRTYEDQWCNGTNQMGVVVLGDSAGAHFHIPPEYLTAEDLNADTFNDLLFILENEFDWPMLSLTTGHFNSTKWKNSINGPMDSLYTRMLKRNRCNHRDYQNIAVNGARSSSMRQIVTSLARNQTHDYPLMVLIELIGNDVCNGHNDTTHMTTPKQFYDNYFTIFKHLDTVLPNGSVVFVSGLVDGRILYESLHNRTHPIGSLRQDVTYTQMYDYLNCLQVSPCFGWMNSNETWRNITTERAQQLNKVLQELVINTTYDNYKLYYHLLPTTELFNNWEAAGGQRWQLIEPVDGFHPNQLANALIANMTWSTYEKMYSSILPPVNPYNDLITKKFGDQGGY